MWSRHLRNNDFVMATMVLLIKDSQIALVAVAIVFGALATAAVCLRLLAAHMSSRRLDASDYSIMVAWLLTMGLMVTCILGTHYCSFIICCPSLLQIWLG